MALSISIQSILVWIMMFGVLSNAQLNSDFYSTTCPNVTVIARDLIEQASRSDVRLTAKVMRLHFHDCFVNGCDGLILLDAAPADGVEGKKEAFQNAGSLDGFEVIDDIKTALENVCPGVVSCADILAIAAEVSVALIDDQWLVGAAWVLRDSCGKVLIPSRRVFYPMASLRDLKVKTLTWAAESMLSHKVDKVIFEIKALNLVMTCVSPKAWLVWKREVEDLSRIFGSFFDYKLASASQSSNRGTFLIAQSVSNQDRIQSYACGDIISILAPETL